MRFEFTMQTPLLGQPNGMRLSCGALKKESFPNLRAPPLQALVRRLRA